MNLFRLDNEIVEDLGQWAIEARVSQQNLEKLTAILRKHNPLWENVIPISARTVLKKAAGSNMVSVNEDFTFYRLGYASICRTLIFRLKLFSTLVLTTYRWDHRPVGNSGLL